jgi:hypothetical protein
MRGDDQVNPAVEAHRKNTHEQLCFLDKIAELRRAQASDPRDLVAAMAAADVAATVEPERSGESEG